MPYEAVGELRIYFEEHGEGDALVLLHGAYQTVELMGPIVPALARTRRVIAPEFQGHGHTADIDRQLTMEALADDTAELARRLGLEHADFFGYSLGGGVALQVAIRHPELVRKLVLVSSAYRSDGWHREALDSFPEITPELFKGSPIEEAYMRTAPNPGDFPVLVEKMTVLDTTPFAWPEEEIRAIDSPALIVVGDSDGTRLDHAAAMFELFGGGVMGDLAGLPASQLAVLPGTSHFVPPGFGTLDRFDWLLPMVESFLDS